VDAERMPDPDTRRLTLAVAENYEQLARCLEVRARRQRHTPRFVQPQRASEGLGSMVGHSDNVVTLSVTPVMRLK
jgi:hypothetical protein